MIWAHSINPAAMVAAIVFIVFATGGILLFALWVLYSLWLERDGELAVDKVRSLRLRFERTVKAVALSPYSLVTQRALLMFRFVRETRR